MMISTERKWTLVTEAGVYLNERGTHSADIGDAEVFDTQHDACEHAQMEAYSAGRRDGGFVSYRAVPVEREAGRKVEAVDDDGRRYALHRDGTYWRVMSPATGNIDEATLLPIESVRSFAPGGWTPVPVRVTEQPGEWRVVEESDGA